MKKLIPALSLLLISAMLLGTSTYAWFSMNTSVTATGMQVTAKSNSTFLLIGSGTNDTADEIQAANPNTTTALTVTAAQSEVFPSKPKEASEIGAEKLFGTGTPVTSFSTAAVAENWYTAQNNNPASSTDSVKNATSLTSFENYVITKTVYLTVADGSDPATNLSVDATIVAYRKTADTALQSKTYYTKDAAGGYTAVALPVVENIGTYYEKDLGAVTAVRVLVTTDDNGFGTLSAATTHAVIKGDNTNLTNTDVRTVNIYIYYDGSDDSVYTNNIANLGDATIELSFNVEVAGA